MATLKQLVKKEETIVAQIGDLADKIAVKKLLLKGVRALKREAEKAEKRK